VRRRGPALLAALAAATALAGLARAVIGSPSGARRAHPSFAIAGSAHRALYPGASRRVRLRLHNRRAFPLLVTRIRVRVRVDRRHQRAGCGARRDYAVQQIPRASYPIRLPAHGTVRLRGFRLPRLRMRNPPDRNQDACHGAELHLRYRGRAHRAP
jgi:hypothetical protein